MCDFIDSGHKSLVISLSVMGAIFGVLILVSLSSFISYISCCLKKNRETENEGSGTGEKEPFLKSSQGNKNGASLTLREVNVLTVFKHSYLRTSS